ncbi:MAG: BON domain-containing protein, partial [Candidatus Omnitrophica bacterium]|nr:BON domain-containing protein [Candidatus Omnitrophota bacterium]
RPYGSYAYGHKLPYYIKPDSRIKSDIQNQLWWSPFIDSDDVMVSVENGVATLQGEVASWSEYHTASKNAFDGGAIWVNNELSVYRNPI